MSRWQRLRPVLPVATAAALAVVLLVACGGPDQGADGDDPVPGPRALGVEHAQALAITRFRNYDDGTIYLDIDAPGAATFDIRALVDLRSHVGYGEYTATDPLTGDELAAGLIAWSGTGLMTTSEGGFGDVPSAEAWERRALERSSPLDVSLTLALNLGADRPENPALLQQSDARLLDTEKDGGETVFVIRGPSSEAAEGQASPDPSAGAADAPGQGRTTYWVTADGDLRRFEARLGGADDLTTTMEVVDGADLPARPPRRVLGYLGAGGL